MEFQADPVVSCRHADIYHDDISILTDVTFDIGKGEFVYLIGRTGSGKSSLLKTLYADIPLKHGEIDVAGYPLHKLKSSQIPYLRRKTGIIFQDFELFYDRNVTDNLLFVMKATNWKDNSKMKQRLSEVLMKVGLGSVGHKMPYQLSGGEQQRVVIARALINEPHILIADEPTGNLDPDVSEGIFQLLHSINSSGTAVLMATHNHNLIRKYPSRTLKCEGEQIFEFTEEMA